MRLTILKVEKPIEQPACFANFHKTGSFLEIRRSHRIQQTPGYLITLKRSNDLPELLNLLVDGCHGLDESLAVAVGC